ncbi:cupredoxin domain-containing protein [Natronococcus wangiae]|uniref:cupredoxin domain-containing protein n=1 Tax=Natronococcus wangiae TaxID=3068275 RepID=UPI00273EBEAA|nr:plastocyanin/azurin family copper-binding protein [Natronococcus sp. AD5]
MTDETSRRTVLGIASGAIGIGLAGCLTESDQPESNSDQDEDTDDQSDEESDHNNSHEEDSGSHGSHGEELDSPSAEAEVSMTTTDSGDHFEPHVVWIEKGGSVTWTNESGSHSATAYHSDNDEPQLVPDEAAAWDSGVLSEAEATFDHVFETEGVYHYYCVPHESAGMIGSVVVGQPDLGAQPALEEPPSEKSEAIRGKLADLNEAVRGALDGQNDDDGQEGEDGSDNEDSHDDDGHDH